MENNFDQLVESYLENKIGISNHFLSDDLCLRLKANIEFLASAELLKAAGRGNETITNMDQLYRSDKIKWLDRKNENVNENEFLDIMDQFVIYLNGTCYTGITSYEFHYAQYQKGSFYLKHFDQFRNDDSRKFSMIFYLNEKWKEGDGGELCIHHIDSLQLISPLNGKGVFFQSNLVEHEVLLTHQERLSITGWFKVSKQ